MQTLHPTGRANKARETAANGYIITAVQHDGTILAVVAPPGYSRSAGQIVRDPVGYRSPSPEWGPTSQPHVFKSHLAAVRIANLCPMSNPTIRATRRVVA